MITLNLVTNVSRNDKRTYRDLETERGTWELSQKSQGFDSNISNNNSLD